MRRITICSLLALTLLAVAPAAAAKMPGFDLQELSESPVAGVPHTITFTLAFPLDAGMPIEGVVAFASPIPGAPLLTPAVIVGGDGYDMLAEATFPVPGTWTLVAFPGVTGQEDREWIATIYPDGTEIEVLPASAAAAEVPAGRTGHSGLGRPIMLGAFALVVLTIAARFDGRRTGRR